jgi:Xaa-Pro aminopeptidase
LRASIASLALIHATALQAQITQGEYAARRDSLAARIDSGIVIAFGGRTPITDFGPFYQNPAFHYLTNFDEPDAVFVMVARGGRGASTLFLMPIEPRRAFYYGRRPDSATVLASHGIRGRAFSALTGVVDSLVGTGLPVYELSDFGDADFASQDSLTRGRTFIKAIVARHPGLVVKDGMEAVDQLRARKSAAEIALLRRAAEISSEGHRAAMLAAEPRHEYELQAALEHAFTRLGGERPAYGSIVGSGANGTQLHYMRDRGETKAGDVVVMDAATQYEGYASDITRTIPVSGKYTVEQKQIYQLVLDAQKLAEQMSKPGLLASAAQDSSVALRTRGLAALGLVESADATFDPPWQVDCTRRPAQCSQANLWMIHGISHGLGLAVHDPMQSSYGDHTYKPGDVFTIEPGIYISSRSLDVLPDTPKNRAFIAKVRSTVLRYENTAVRIEDDYLIIPTGLERLSTAPREIAEIEALMRKRPRVITP